MINCLVSNRKKRVLKIERLPVLCFLVDANGSRLMLDISSALISHLSSHLLKNQSLSSNLDKVNVILIY